MSDVNFDLLDISVDELADLEAFSPIPAGTYRLAISWEKKAINDKPAVTLKLKVLEVFELASHSETPPDAGKTSDVAFILSKDDGTPNTIGQGQLKEVIKVLQETFGGSTASEIMEATEGAEVIGTLKVRASKADKDQKYNSIAKISVPS